MRYRTVVLLIAGLGTLGTFGALGCGRVREVRGCRSLARLVNPALDDVAQRLTKDHGPAAYRFAATRYGALAAELKQFDIGIRRAEPTVDDFRGVLKEASVQSAQLADGLEKQEPVVAASARRELGNLARRHKALVSRIDDDCGE